MNVLIDIGHPAHVHLFKNFAKILNQHGHTVLFTLRKKEFEEELLKYYKFKYVVLGKHFLSKIGKLFGLFIYTIRLVLLSQKFRPDILLSHGSIYAAWASYLIKKPHISLEDTGNREQVRLYLPFTDTVITSTSFKHKYKRSQIFYSGYHEIAYLHPRYFKPDENVLSDLKINECEKYFLIRIVSWNATHDKGHFGISEKQLESIIKVLLTKGRVFISSEKQLPIKYEKYKFSLPPNRIHDALAFAELLISEGATMASESAVLGTPTVYINTIEAGSIDEQEKFGLLFHFRSSEGVLKKVVEIVNTPNIKNVFSENRSKLLDGVTDLTTFLVWFIENFPESKMILSENPNYLKNFK